MGFSGIIRCAECGSSMAFNSKPQSHGISEQYRCTRYAMYGKAQCTTHAITLETLESVVLADIKYYASIATQNEAELANRFIGMAEHQLERTQDVQEIKIRDSKRQISEIDRAVKKLFEEKVAGNVPEGIFKNLLLGYEAEQNALRETIAENEEQMQKSAAVETDVMTWVLRVKACFSLERLDRATALELIDYVEVSERIAADGTKKQDISIKYKFVGNIDEIPEKVLRGA